jgi:hypothetical protein
MRTNQIWAPAMAAVLVVSASCARPRIPARVVQLEMAAGDTTTLMTLPYLWSGQGSGNRQEAWLSPGSLLFGGSGLVFFSLTGDSARLQLEFTDWSVRLSGQVVSLNLGKDSAAIWLRQSSTADLAGLRFLMMTDSIPAAMQPDLERLAAANPRIALDVESGDNLEWMLGRFDPLTLMLLADASASSLAGEPQVEQLYLESIDSSVAEVLPTLLNLRSLWLSDLDLDFDLDPEQSLHLPRQLEELTVVAGDVQMSRLDTLPNLRTLRLTSSEWTGGSDLRAMTHLRWFGLPMNATQGEFADIIEAHSDLEVLELVRVDSVIDLSPLRGARRLRAITLSGAFTNLSVLREIPTLEFVGFSKEMMEKSPDEVAAIRAALPGAAVVQVTEFCLGSGWILLLVPLVLFALMARPARRAA